VAKSIKETIREAFKTGKPLKPSEPIDPMMINDEEDSQETSLIEDMGEKDTNKDEEDGVSFDDFEKNNLVSNQGTEGAKDEGKLVEGTDDEAPPATEPEPEASDKGTRTVIGGSSPESEGSTEGEPTGTWKVKTVYGEEEVDFKKLKAGYMMQKHYTQLTQMLRNKERRVADMLSNPDKLVRFAIQNGVDLKPLVHAGSDVKEFKLPPLPEYATEGQKQQHELLQGIIDDRNAMKRKLDEVEGAFKKRGSDERWEAAEAAFEKERGEDIPEGAKFLGVLLLNEGQRQHGEAYQMRNAMADLRMVLKAAQQNVWNSPEGKRREEEIKRFAVEEYKKTKKRHEEETISGDSLPPTKLPAQGQKPKKFKNIAEAIEAAKEKYGITR
jgi:hypothetical protein